MRTSLLTALGADLHDVVLRDLSRKELCTLCLVSKESRCLAEPYLYSKIDWQWMLHSEPPIIPFLKTILARPKLAAHVRSVVLRGSWQNISWTGQDYHPETEPAWRERVCFTLSKTDSLVSNEVRPLFDKIEAPLAFIDTWMAAIQANEMDALVALLLSQTLDIEHLSIDGRSVIGTKLIGKMFKLALIDKVSGLPRYSRLKSVHLAPLFVQLDYYGRYLDWYLPYFALPAIETLLLPLDNPPDLASKLQGFHTLPALRHLKIAQCRETQLKSLLHLTPGLQSFAWEAFSEGYDSPPRDVMDLNVLHDALRPFQHSLHSLVLSTRFMKEEPPRFEPGRILGDLTWIRTFNKLRHLALDLPLLEGLMSGSQMTADDLLPGSLQELLLYHDDLSSLFGSWKHETWQFVELANDYFRPMELSRPQLTMSLLVTDRCDYLAPGDKQRIKTLISRKELNITLQEYQRPDMYENVAGRARYNAQANPFPDASLAN
ncbi:hypothetical protein AMS68_001827 [Peltaster fructicola]|uniref:F-box domain-containing protein n=1 Tax=Peltaster fructicola TaxID=286661 RepID=A0A6H0XP96_9PEZI|nr:hypothetical protein AMS68_001827 [Peltaster fructicola]